MRRLTLIAVAFVGCSSRVPGELALSMTSSGGGASRLRAVATMTDGTVGEGLVKFSAPSGSFSNDEVRLDGFGTAATDFACGACAGTSVRVTAEWTFADSVKSADLLIRPAQQDGGTAGDGGSQGGSSWAGRILFVGPTSAGAGETLIGPLDEAATVGGLGALPFASILRGYSASGDIYYSVIGVPRVLRWKPDLAEITPQTSGGVMWWKKSFPATIDANDAEVPSPPCQDPFYLQFTPDTDEGHWICLNAGGPRISTAFTASGSPVPNSTNVMLFGAAGSRLFFDRMANVFEVETSGSKRPVAIPGFVVPDSLIPIRAVTDGFLVLLLSNGKPCQLFHLPLAPGPATARGDYSSLGRCDALPGFAFAHNIGTSVFDRSANLLTMTADEKIFQVDSLGRRTLLYDEATLPTESPKLLIYMHNSYLMAP